jgi:hypothetical protein
MTVVPASGICAERKMNEYVRSVWRKIPLIGHYLNVDIGLANLVYLNGLQPNASVDCVLLGFAVPYSAPVFSILKILPKQTNIQ